MTRRTSPSTNSARAETTASLLNSLGGGSLWIGKHDDDQDILVMDPAVADPDAQVLSLYSLTQHRTRRFPRALVLDRIHAVTDEAAREHAQKAYDQRETLRNGHEQALGEAKAERIEQMREGMIASHERFIGSLGLEYKGVRKSAEPRSGRTLKCYSCEFVLDDFVGVSCMICSGVLCSCGACSCGKPASGRRTTTKARSNAESEE